MLEDLTLLTNTIPGEAGLQRMAVPATRTKLQPQVKLTRAHLALLGRPALAAEWKATAARIAQKLGPQLKATLSCEASLLPSTLHPFSHLATRAVFWVLELGGDAIGVLELDLLGVGAVLGRITGANEPVAVPTKLSHIEEAALGWFALTTLAAVRAEPSLASLSPRLVTVTTDRGEVLREVDARRRYVAVQLKLDVGGTPCLARLVLPALWLQAKVEAAPVEAPPALHAALADTALTTRCFVGSAYLPRKDLVALCPGDVVCLPGVRCERGRLDGPGRLVTESFELRGAFSSTGFTLTRAFERPTQEHPAMSSNPTVPVEVEIELTRLRVPLHQLAGIQPGGVLPLHINAAQHVVLRIGEKAVARAELVEIEGELGARVVAML